MRIGIITSPFGPLPPKALGAVEKRWYYMGLEMERQGHEVIFYAKDSDDYNPDAPIISIKGFNRSKYLLIDLVNDFFYSLQALRRLKKCDILIMNTFWSPILSPLFKTRYSRSVYNVARMPKKHFVLYRYVDQFSCVSQIVKRRTLDIVSNSRNVVTVNNPVNLDYFHYYHRRPISAGETINIGYHGRIHREKGLDLLCQAMQQLSSEYRFRLVLIGAWTISDGGSGDEYVNFLRELCPSVEVELVPPIYQPQLLDKKISMLDIYCYPSVAETGETFGVAPLEAMATGCPTIVSSLECFMDFVEDGVTGVRFNHRQENPSRELASKIKMVIEDDSLRKRISTQGYKKAQEFSVSAIATKYLMNFEALLES